MFEVSIVKYFSMSIFSIPFIILKTSLWNHFYDQRILFNHDGLHLNPVGSARLGRILSDAVEAHRKKRDVEGVSDPLPKIRRETPVQRQQLKVCLVNARSLRNKFHDLTAIAFLENFDIIGVTESWVNTEKRDFLAEYNIPGYSLFSCERSERTGGGVLLYVKPHLHPQVITKPQISNIDVKYVQILSGSEKLIPALVYRPPAQNSKVDNELYEQISDICNHNDAIIFGDFNLPVTVRGGTLNSHSGHELYSNILESSLYQHIYEPTHGESILDIVLSTNDSQINNVDIGPEFSTSDHKSVFFTIECNTGVHNKSYEKVPDFRRAVFDKLRTILENTDRSEIYEIQDVEQAWNMFIDILRNALTECVPMRSRRLTTLFFRFPIRLNSRPMGYHMSSVNCLAGGPDQGRPRVLIASCSNRGNGGDLSRRGGCCWREVRREIDGRPLVPSRLNLNLRWDRIGGGGMGLPVVMVTNHRWGHTCLYGDYKREG